MRLFIRYVEKVASKMLPVSIFYFIPVARCMDAGPH